MRNSEPVSQNLYARVQSNLLLWILAAGGAITFFLNALVDNAVVFHDEYVYKAAADMRLPAAELFAKGAIEYIPNRLFLLVYRIASYGEQNFYIAAQFLNVVFWTLGLYLVCKLAQLLGLEGKRLVAFAMLMVLLPFSIYTKYFMPEAMFFCLFAASAFLLFKGISSSAFSSVFAAGVAAGLAYYVKPHALIFFGVTLLFLVAARAEIAGRWRTVGMYAAGFVLIVLIATALIDKPASLARLGVYDHMVKGMMATSARMLSDPWTNLRALGIVGLGHLVSLASIWSLSLAATVSASHGVLRGRPVEPANRPARLFNMWLMFITSALIVVVVAFTVLVGEVGRIHSRYYCFAYPFLLLSLFLYRPGQHRRATKIAVAAVAVCAGLAVLALPQYSSILAISLVSDSPELGFAFYARATVAVAVALLIASQVWMAWRSPVPAWLVLATLFVASQYYVREAQGHMFRGPYTDGKDALVVEQVLGADALRAALVVGDSRDVLSKFLFNLSVVPTVTVRPFDQLEQVLQDYPAAPTYLFLSDKLDSVPGLVCEKLGPRVLRCRKS
jgi:phosphoglycerol transferase